MKGQKFTKPAKSPIRSDRYVTEITPLSHTGLQILYMYYRSRARSNKSMKKEHKPLRFMPFFAGGAARQKASNLPQILVQMSESITQVTL